MSLSKYAITGLKWSTTSQIVKQAFQYFSIIILTGLLSPSDFGLMSMALIFIGFIEIFKDLGTISAVIQRQNLSDTLLSSIYWLNILWGGTIFLSLYFLAYLIADFYTEPRLINIFRVLSINFVLAGLSSVPRALLEKKIKFYLISSIELISVTFGMIVAIVLAIYGFGVWSLVYQSVAAYACVTIGYFYFEEWKPSMKFNLGELKEITGYSGNLLGYNIFNFFVRNADYLLIGKFLGDRALGHYYLAYRIMLYPIQNISNVVSRVMFPVYSAIQNDNKKLQSIYIKIANAISLITFPMMLGLMLVSFMFATIFFRNNWDSNLIGLLLLILSPIGLIQSISTTTGPIYQVKNKTNWYLIWGLVTGIVAISAFSIGLYWGVIGVAVSYLVITLLWNYHLFSIPFSLIELDIWTFAKSFKEIAIASTVMFVFALTFKLIIVNYMSNFWSFLLTIIFGIIIYVMAIIIFAKNKISEFLEIYNQSRK